MYLAPTAGDALSTTAAMEIGKVLTYDGRTYVLLGMEPMSVPERRVELEDTETGEVLRIPCSLLARSSEGLSKQP